jgi:16S rRNA (cytosine1402-N4)-methyltransferase
MARDGRLDTTRALVETVERALGGHAHPRRLAQVFQALRVWINDEAAELEAALDWLPSAMRPGGVVVTIAYHSGEDRRIKHALRGNRVASRRIPWPAQPGLPEGPWEEMARKVVRPEPTETERNPRARSARLRAFRRKSR